MTTTAIVTGPVTSVVSMLWHAGDPETMGGCAFGAIPVAVIQLPVGWALVIAAGFEKDGDYLRTGSYRTPGTRALRWVFDPYWGFPLGVVPPEGIYPPAKNPDPATADTARPR